MRDMQEVSIIRAWDHKGDVVQLIARPENASDLMTLEKQNGSDWDSDCKDMPSILLDTSGVVQLTDPEQAMRLAQWIFTAATWLRMEQLEGSDELESDDEDVDGVGF
jgi:hypothetical protein